MRAIYVAIAKGVFLTMLIFMPVSSQATNQVYECVVAGQRVFSDQPCGAGQQTREIAQSNRMVATVVRGEPTSKSRKSHADGDADSDDTDKKKSACNGIRTQQSELRDKQRTGYSLAQGERLRAREEKLSQRYALLKCERYR